MESVKVDFWLGSVCSLSVVIHAVTEEPLSIKPFPFLPANPICSDVVGLKSYASNNSQNSCTEKQGIHLFERRKVFCMHDHYPQRQKEKLQARGVIFALNHLGEVLKGNVIPRLNFFLLEVFIILSW